MRSLRSRASMAAVRSGGGKAGKRASTAPPIEPDSSVIDKGRRARNGRPTSSGPAGTPPALKRPTKRKAVAADGGSAPASAAAAPGTPRKRPAKRTAPSASSGATAVAAEPPPRAGKAVRPVAVAAKVAAKRPLKRKAVGAEVVPELNSAAAPPGKPRKRPPIPLLFVFAWLCLQGCARLHAMAHLEFCAITRSATAPRAILHRVARPDLSCPLCVVATSRLIVTSRLVVCRCCVCAGHDGACGARSEQRHAAPPIRNQKQPGGPSLGNCFVLACVCRVFARCGVAPATLCSGRVPRTPQSTFHTTALYVHATHGVLTLSGTN